MDCTWIAPNEIDDLLNPNFYRKIYLDATRKVNGDENPNTLASISIKISDGPFGSQLKNEEYLTSGIPLFRVSDIENLLMSLVEIVFISPIKQQQLSRSKVLPGDILITKAGRIGSAAVIPQSISEANITSHLALIRLRNGIDPYYIVAFLESKYGKLLSERSSHKSTRPELTKTEVAKIPVYLVDPKTQTYIGDKVRLAEKCREEALISKNRAYENLRNLMQNPVQGYSNRNTESFKKLLDTPYCVSIKPDLLTERLTAVSYNNNFLEFMALVDDSIFEFIELGDHYDISAMIGWKNLTTADYVSQGIKMLRVADIGGCFALLDDAVQVSSTKVDEQPQIHLQERDIVFSKDGTLGIAAVIPQLDELVCAGSTLARLRNKTRELDPYFLCAFLNSTYTTAQISYYISGIAQPHITQEYIKQIKVPLLPIEQQLEIGQAFKRYDFLSHSAHDLIVEAKNDIENLIEGELRTADAIAGNIRCMSWNELSSQLDCQINDHA